MKTIAAIILLIALPAVAGAQQPQYRITSLTLPNVDVIARASAINDRGQVVGTLVGVLPSGDFYGHAFLYSNGQIQDLGTIAGDYSNAVAINNHAQVVGSTSTWSGPGTDFYFVHPFLWSAGTMIDLGGLSKDIDPGAAFGINDLGIVVGQSPVIIPFLPITNHAFIYQGGVMADLGLVMDSTASGINNFNQVVGTVDTLSDSGTYYTRPTKAYLWQRGKSRFLPSLGGTSNYAAAINDLGHVVGSSQLAGDTVVHGFLYADHKMIDLGPAKTHSSQARALNRLDQVVGNYSPDATAPYITHAVLWQKGKMIDLNTLIDPRSGWVLEEATGINDLGQIVGNGSQNGSDNAFLLTPYYNRLSQHFWTADLGEQR